jgi:hypothetical protein
MASTSVRSASAEARLRAVWAIGRVAERSEGNTKPVGPVSACTSLRMVMARVASGTRCCSPIFIRAAGMRAQIAGYQAKERQVLAMDAQPRAGRAAGNSSLMHSLHDLRWVRAPEKPRRAALECGGGVITLSVFVPFAALLMSATIRSFKLLDELP